MSSSPQSSLIQDIIASGKKAFDPSLDAASREDGQKNFDQLLERTETYTLLPALNSLIKPNVLPPWLREPLMQALTRLPLRPDGVRGTMEFVFSVHPSSERQGAAEAGQPQKQGANITHEAIAIASRLLSSVPPAMSPQQWFHGISGQLFSLIDGDAGPDLAKTAAQIVGFGILGKKQLGAPGAPGWDAFVQPLLNDINPSLRVNFASREDDDGVVDLSQGQILVPALHLKQSLHRMRTLVLSNPSPGLCWRLLKQIAVQLWALASWGSPSPMCVASYCEPARALFHTYLTLFGKPELVNPLIHDLLRTGSEEGVSTKWHFQANNDRAIHIVRDSTTQTSTYDLDWTQLDSKASMMVDALVKECSVETISSIFLKLLQHWIQTTQAGKGIDIGLTSPNQAPDSPIQDLIKVTLLQKLMENASDKLVSHFDQLIELVCQVLRADNKAELEDDAIAVVLSLLNLVITAPTFRKSDINQEDLRLVQDSLAKISNQDRSDASATATNLGLLLKYRDEVETPGKETATVSARQIEDRNTYKLAMEYITGADNPPPVVSEGLNLLSQLIVAESRILDITAVTVLMSDLLRDNDDFVNLRVIKIFTQLAERHPKLTSREILDHYLDAQEKSTTDVRLRFGEALLQVIERLGQTFTGDAAEAVSETLLSIASRRGYRPKTLKKQVREERLQKLKELKGGSADAEEDEMPTEDEEVTEEDKARNDVLAQILQGWESKRGSEDVRMRASALSILGRALETSIAGVGPMRVSAAVDLCLNVLAMEPEMEKGILRRAAIIVILSFVKALSQAQEEGRSLGFGLTNTSREDIVTTLQYIAATDNDGLVQQHAEDVVESLENWQMASLIPRQTGTGAPALMTLAGLQVNPGVSLNSGGSGRFKIEEIE